MFYRKGIIKANTIDNSTLGQYPFGKKGISLYVDKDGELKSSIRENVHSHYVTVTGVCTIKGREYLVVSSWGKKYYIDYKEYRNYVNNVGDKFTSGILYIQGLL